jgi:hypothetical protein
LFCALASEAAAAGAFSQASCSADERGMSCCDVLSRHVLGHAVLC